MKLVDRPAHAKSADAKRITVLASPAYNNFSANPYNSLLSAALQGEGCDLIEMNRRNRLLSSPNVAHVHWPQSVSKGKFWKALRESMEYLVAIASLRIRGTVVVWTVHNINAHDQNNPHLESVMMSIFTRLISGAIFLSKTSQAEALGSFPALRSVPTTYIPHGLYGKTYVGAISRTEMRQQLAINAGDKVVGIIGDIRPYKGVLEVLQAATEKEIGGATLLIAGELRGNVEYNLAFRKLVGKLRGKGYPVKFVEKRLTNEEMIDFIVACDAVALPYSKVANSGLALLALEHGATLLTSDKPLFREMADDAGRDRVVIVSEYCHYLSPMTPGEPDNAKFDEFLDARSWKLIARETLEFYRCCGLNQ